MTQVYLAFVAARSWRRQRVFRDRTQFLDNEEISDEQLMRDFRFPRKIIFEIIQFAGVLPRRTRRSHAISPETQVLVALRFFARGTYQDDVKDILGVSQQTVSRCIEQFCHHMLPKLSQVIKFPDSEEDTRQTKANFYDKSGFPDVIGVIDGTHIFIKTPSPELECAFVCRKGGHSINAQVVCNSDLLITNITANSPGSFHDSFIWSQCGLRQKFYSGPPPGFLLGDSGYPLEPWLLAQYENPATRSQIKYNAKFVSTRSTVERTIGVWKNVFRVIHHEAGVLEYEPKKAAQIIMVSAMLHNFRRRLRLQEDDNFLVLPELDTNPVGNITSEALQLQGKRIRDSITTKYFN